MTATWEEVAIPILRWVSEHEGPGPFGVGQVAEVLGLQPMTVYSELERLTASGYIAGHGSSGVPAEVLNTKS
jgi:DNA-binding IclR family transcriptional regulator